MMQLVELVPEVQSLAEAADAAPPGTTVWASAPPVKLGDQDRKWPCLTTLRNLNSGTLAVYTWTSS